MSSSHTSPVRFPDTSFIDPTDLQDVRDETEKWIIDAFADASTGTAALVEAPCASGKTRSTFEAAQRIDTPITYLTSRHELYQDARDYCKDAGLNHRTLLNPYHDCPTFRGDHGDVSQAEATELYNAGVGGRLVHELLDLPCLPVCPYLDGWDFDPTDYDVLIGHYQHAYVEAAVEDRIIVIDEYPGDAFVSEITKPQELVTEFLQQHNELPWDDWGDLIERRWEERHPEFLWWLEDSRLARDPFNVVHQPGERHTLAPLLTCSLLYMSDLGNGFESTREYEHWGEEDEWILKDHPEREILFREQVCIRSRKTDEMWVLAPPNLTAASGIVGLDATPTRRLWETALGKRLDHRRILTPTQTSTYLKEALNLQLVQAGEGIKSYSSGNYVAEDHDAALFWGVEARHGEKPALIAPKKALDVYESTDLLETISASKTYGEVLSSNAFSNNSLGIVSGSPHPGDPTFQREAALMGFSIKSNGEKGEAKSYGEHGDPIHQHFVHNQVLQAICRFGRDADEATVYINTTAIPDWLAFDKKVQPMLFTGEKTREIMTCLREYEDEGATQQVLADDVGCSKRYVRDRLSRLVDAGYVEMNEYAGRNGQHIYIFDRFQ